MRILQSARLRPPGRLPPYQGLHLLHELLIGLPQAQRIQLRELHLGPLLLQRHGHDQGYHDGALPASADADDVRPAGHAHGPDLHVFVGQLSPLALRLDLLCQRPGHFLVQRVGLRVTANRILQHPRSINIEDGRLVQIDDRDGVVHDHGHLHTKNLDGIVAHSASGTASVSTLRSTAAAAVSLALAFILVPASGNPVRPRPFLAPAALAPARGARALGAGAAAASAAAGRPPTPLLAPTAVVSVPTSIVIPRVPPRFPAVVAALVPRVALRWPIPSPRLPRRRPRAPLARPDPLRLHLPRALFFFPAIRGLRRRRRWRPLGAAGRLPSLGATTRASQQHGVRVGLQVPDLETRRPLARGNQCLLQHAPKVQQTSTSLLLQLSANLQNLLVDGEDWQRHRPLEALQNAPRCGDQPPLPEATHDSLRDADANANSGTRHIRGRRRRRRRRRSRRRQRR
mmetsp:Transcript_31201/g.99513  ORF Transcript_31201/g.99513 Transcript_31201/m.99513 type:complete len:457 (+) Transcript_31201:186-1556(+)